MTPDEALALLRGGPHGIAKWNLRRGILADRKQLPNLIRADLRGADLRGVDLRGMYLHWADLRGANLRGVDLYEANLYEANLGGVNLDLADLRGANLHGANLHGASLFGCQLNRAELGRVDGRRTDFSMTQLVSEGFWRWVRGVLIQLVSWQTVRAVGGLQVLTKASYIMLALVPLLAGAWQGVKVWVGQSKHDVSEALKHIDRSADRRHDQIDAATNQEAEQLRGATRRLQTALEQREKWWLGAAPKDAVEALKDVDRAIEHHQAAILKESAHDTDELHKATQKLQALLERDEFNPRLPVAWALGFFAALFVALGHFVYQIACPELVKEQTADKFADSLLSGFSSDSAGHDRRDRLARATNALGELADRMPTRRHRNLVRRHGRVVWIPSNPEFFEEPTEPAASPEEKSASTEPAAAPASEPDEKPVERPATEPLSPVVSAGPGLMRVAIDEGARAEYQLKSLEKRGPAVAAFLLYAVAGVLIGWLVLSQSWAVAKAAGWAA
jgi:hypothetical protein